jgi:hypothetical protein
MSWAITWRCPQRQSHQTILIIRLGVSSGRPYHAHPRGAISSSQLEHGAPSGNSLNDSGAILI